MIRKRPITTRDKGREIEVDIFAGGGGASQGIAEALGRGPTIAINHNADAIRMHAANHPETQHHEKDVWKLSPREVTKGRAVGLLWASPDCTHFSRAKGGKPVKKEIRSLAWVVVRWAEAVSPRVIILENVREFEDWGPLLPMWRCQGCQWRGTEGQVTLVRKRPRCPRCESKSVVITEDQIPDPKRKGLTFKRFIGRLRNLGYVVEWRVLNAADFGAPTHRRRLFLCARNDGAPIVWPESSHGDPKKLAAPTLFAEPRQPWRTAAECIDWSIECPSIFMTRDEARAWAKERKCAPPQRPLREKTMRRIALGIKRYVLDNPRPFIITYYGANKPSNDFRGNEADEPIRTIPADPRFGVVVPQVIRFRGDAETSGRDPEQPLPTITAGSNSGKPAGAGHALGVVTPILTPLTHDGERRSQDVREPLPTVTGAHRGEVAVISPTLIGAGGPEYSAKPRSVDRPMGAMITEPRTAVVAPVLARIGQQGGNGKYVNAAGEPLTSIVSKAEHVLVTPILAQRYGEFEGREQGRATTPDQPMNTITPTANAGVLVAPTLINAAYGADGRWGDGTADLSKPIGTIHAGGKNYAVVSAFLAKHFGRSVGHSPGNPLGTATAHPHESVVAANLVHLNKGPNPATGCDDPLRTIVGSGNHAALVYSFMMKYHSTGGQWQGVFEPMHTIDCKDRFGVVVVNVEGEPFIIVDIGMRMLRPRELARGQGFADSYHLTGSASSQVERIGNSVPPALAKAMVRANYKPQRVPVAA